MGLQVLVWCWLVISFIETRHILGESMTWRGLDRHDNSSNVPITLFQDGISGNGENVIVEVRVGKTKAESESKAEIATGTRKEDKVKVSSEFKARVEKLLGFGANEKSKLQEQDAEPGTRKKMNPKVEPKLKLTEGTESNSEAKKTAQSLSSVRVEKREKKTSTRKKVDAEIPSVLKTRGLQDRLKSLHHSTTNALNLGAPIVSGTRMIRPFVEWMKTTCRNLPVNYSTLKNAYGGSKHSGSEAKGRVSSGVHRPNGYKSLPIELIHDEFQDKQLDIYSGSDSDGTKVPVQRLFEVGSTSRRQMPKMPPESLERATSEDEQHRKALPPKGGHGVGVQTGVPPDATEADEYASALISTPKPIRRSPERSFLQSVETSTGEYASAPSILPPMPPKPWRKSPEKSPQQSVETSPVEYASAPSILPPSPPKPRKKSPERSFQKAAEDIPPNISSRYSRGKSNGEESGDISSVWADDQNVLKSLTAPLVESPQKSPPKESPRKSPPKESSRKSPPKESPRKSPPKESSRKSPPKESSRKPPPKESPRKSPPKESPPMSPPREVKDSNGKSVENQTPLSRYRLFDPEKMRELRKSFGLKDYEEDKEERPPLVGSSSNYSHMAFRDNDAWDFVNKKYGAQKKTY